MIICQKKIDKLNIHTHTHKHGHALLVIVPLHKRDHDSCPTHIYKRIHSH